MFLKRFTFLAFLATIFTSAQAQQLDATFDLVRFKVSDSKNMVELYCSVNGNSVVYKAVPGGFQASVALEVLVSDSVGVRAAEKLLLKSPVVKDTAAFQAPFNVQKRLFLPNGKFTFTGTAQDMNSKQPASKIEAPLLTDFKADKVQFSDVQLLEKFEKSSEKSEYVKSGYKLVSYVSNFYPKGMDRLKFYTELYHTDKVLGKDKPMVVLYRVVPTRDNLATVTIAGQKILKAAPVSALLTELDISTLASGNYELALEVRNEENKIVAYQTRYFQRSNPQTAAAQVAQNLAPQLPAAFTSDLDSTNLNLYIRALRPIANSAEQDILETAVKSTTLQKQNYLYSFFKKRSETDPVRAWLEYKNRIEYVEKTFANQSFAGYETDRGRVYLQYGPPNQITNERTDINRSVGNSDAKPYQIWQYYHLEKQRNREFVFLQRNMGNPNYNLVHSTANGEVTDPSWRKQAYGRFGNNKKFGRDADEEGTLDGQGNVIQVPLEPKK